MADMNKKNMTLADFDELMDKRTMKMQGACNAYLGSHECAFIVNTDNVENAQLVKLTTNTSWEEEGDTEWASLNRVTLTYQYNDWSKVKSREWNLSREDCRTLISKLQGILDAADALDEHVKAMPACREASIKATESKAA